ncbi:alpha-L-rhamnosidase [Gracilibacillus halotolerans]|uniref:alpha-L-rhamnosidase n=1 Tax=Gracilibacillus halotolerans TaxID=74386 RepID=A0A841RJY2_9BACI|nr:glycoside hydrolase family 78 protein [Gracilibacillus halotolerans]MBB6512819.1 alpha-L-rhamnosidase [Gracilibacillus halotolerans]
MLSVYDVRIEYQKNPIGIDVTKPRVSWKIQAEGRNVRQGMYHLQVATEDSFDTVVWDSGEVSSDESLHISLDGLNPISKTRYYVRVRVADQHGNETDWSETTYFEMGLMQPKEWQAKWISTPESMDKKPSPQFKVAFEAKGKVKKARIYATALGLYELHLNGERVGEDYFTPGWTSYHTRLQYQTYDVTRQLVEGNNEWTALLGNGWYRGNLGWENQKEIYGNRLGLLAELHVEYEDGKTEVIVTDESWQVTESAIRESELYHGETVDAQFVSDNWQAVDILSESKYKLVAQENELVRKIHSLSAKELIRTPNGEIVIDFGQNMVGWVEFDIEGKPGQTVEIKHAEILDGDGNFYTANLRTAKQTNQYILSGEGKETFAPRFSFQGFRYVQLIGFEEDQLQLDNFHGMVLHSDMEMTGDFKSSDDMINQLQHNIVWGLKGNFLDVPTDCPQRDERLGWTGDAQMFIRTASYLANVAPFFTKWLRDVEADQREDGSVPFVVPNVLSQIDDPESDDDHNSFGSAAWGDAAVINPWTLYIAYGDKRILQEQYDSMKAWVSYIKAQGDNPYLWNTGFHFGDWLALDSKPDSYVGATDRAYIATAFFAYSTSIVKKTAEILGKEEDYQYYAELEDNIVNAFQDEYVTPSGNLAVPTQTAHVLALMFDLVDTQAKSRVVKELDKLLQETDYHLTTGFVGTPYLNHVLTENGLNDAAYTLLFQKDYPSWLYQITKGATTIWEHWDGIKEDGSFWSTDMNSFNHYAYGAIGDWLYRKVAGIELDEEVPAFKQFTIQPHIGEGLDWVEATYESMYGEIKSAWRKTEAGGMELEVIVPVNTTAQVKLLGAKIENVKENNTPLSQASGILSFADPGDSIDILIGSGTYRFTY